MLDFNVHVVVNVEIRIELPFPSNYILRAKTLLYLWVLSSYIYDILKV